MEAHDLGEKCNLHTGLNIKPQPVPLLASILDVSQIAHQQA